MKTAKILVFDTGSGGLAFAKFLATQSKNYSVETLIDTENSPYGPRSDREISGLVKVILSPHIGKFDIIVLACNTATAVAIDELRTTYPEQIFIGFEPMIKTAASLTKTNVIAVLATAATKKSPRYKALKQHFSNLNIIEPDCNSWAEDIDKQKFTIEDVKKSLEDCPKNVDTIVLGCTHYVAKKDLIQAAVGNNIKVIEPFTEVAEHIAEVLQN